MSLFFQSVSCENVTNNGTKRVYQNQMQTLDEMFNWLAILWERGLFHENPQGMYMLLSVYFCSVYLFLCFSVCQCIICSAMSHYGLISWHGLEISQELCKICA